APGATQTPVPPYLLYCHNFSSLNVCLPPDRIQGTNMAAEVVALSPASRLPSLSSRPAASSSSRAHRAARSARSPPALAVTTFALGRRRQALLLLRPRATEQQGQVQQQEEEVVDGNVLPYCSIDGKKKKTIGEMEQEFLRALQSFYYDQKAIMSNEEFDNLKEELMWEGSSVVMLSADEQRLLEASMAYIAGNPIMSDAEFDELKLRLKQDGSDIVTEGPRCSLRSRKVYSDLTVDYLKMFLLNVPATIVALGLFFFIDELTGFEVNVFQFPEPFGFIFTYFAALPLILVTAQVVTKAIINDVLILKGAVSELRH
uniref:PGR5-like protein 1A, chloroplastic n=1 Tax=Aegilops tauschii subsp. strangulata TaxID=200361 RepID=A0A453MKV7_AEGTS